MSDDRILNYPKNHNQISIYLPNFATRLKRTD
jgi:hypothetical protein